MQDPPSSYNWANIGLVPEYAGDWIRLQMPQRVSYSYLRLYSSSAADYRVYGRNGASGTWTLLQEVLGATYTSNVHFSPTVTNSPMFDTLAFAVARVKSGIHELTIGELSFYAGIEQPCPAGLFAVNDSSVSTCLSCYPGTYSTGGAVGPEGCPSCEAGKFSGYYGASNCSSCPAGYWSSEVAAVDISTCQACPAGFYSSTPGGNSLGSCLPCPAGQYQNATGQTRCLTCPAGSYSMAGWASCPSCPTGTYAATPNTANACPYCPSGQYQNLTGQTGCILCDPGLFSSQGSPLCANCQPGTFAPVYGSTNCTLCAPGSYANYQGTVQCTRCALGTFGNETGALVASVCQPCPPGTFTNVTGSTKCTACPSGRYTGSFGSSECGICPRGSATGV